MTNQQKGVLARIFFQHPLKVGKTRLGSQRGFDVKFAFVTEFVSDQRSGLSATFEWAGKNRISLDFERSQGATDVSALIETLFVEGAFLVPFGAGERYSGTGMAQKINIHHRAILTFREAFR